MAIHYQAFREELYSEHLDEAAFQYETRLQWLHDDEIGWQELADIDRAIEAHIDALVVGNSRALKVCIDNLAAAEAMTLHVIVRVFCRHRLMDRLSQLWGDFDFDNSDAVSAVADALKWECPDDWFASLHKVFAGEKAEMFPVLAPSVVYRSRSSGESLLAGLDNVNERDLASLAWAISRCERKVKQQATVKLAPLLDHTDPLVAQRVAVALMMMGESRTLSQCRDRIYEMPVAFALGGDRQEISPIIHAAQQGRADANIVSALGLAGSLDAVAHLLTYLQHADLAPAAAQALQLISGASLYEEVYVEEKIEEDELFEHELEAFKQGELPKNIDGNPFGVEVKKLSVDHTRWFQWFAENKRQFDRSMRYRNGKPYCPSELLVNMLDNQSAFEIRQFAYEEMVIRYGMDLPFFADDLVHEQMQQINDVHAWVQRAQTGLTAGKWCFNGRELF